MTDPLIMPSLLAANHANLWGALSPLLPLPWIHLDIMDGHFVPNLSFGPQLLANFRQLALNEGIVLPQWDVHLMLSNPSQFVTKFAQAGADRITIHGETGDEIEKSWQNLEKFPSKRGLAINPGTPLSLAMPYLPRIDLLLIMTVQPGFGSQPFLWDVLPKIREAKNLRARLGLNFSIQVDGGIDDKTITAATQAGANILVSGSNIFSATNPRLTYESLCQQANEACQNPPYQKLNDSIS